MAYISIEQIKEKRIKINEVCKRYGMKATIRRESYLGSMRITIRSGRIDFREDSTTEIANYDSYSSGIMVNPYWISTYWNLGSKSFDFLQEIVKIAYEGNHDNSDPMTDYFDVGWYVHINIGEWKKPYQLTK